MTGACLRSFRIRLKTAKRLAAWISRNPAECEIEARLTIIGYSGQLKQRESFEPVVRLLFSTHMHCQISYERTAPSLTLHNYMYGI